MERKEPFIKLDKEPETAGKHEASSMKIRVNPESNRFDDIDRAFRAQEYRLEKKAENALLTFLKFEFWKTVVLGLSSLAFMLWIFSSTPTPKEVMKMFKVPVVKTQPQKVEKQEDKKVNCISRNVDEC